MEIVELRVHGVHGTSPGAMLGVDDKQVGQVAGDGLTGIYRANDGVELPYRDLKGTQVSVEAYSWGALTSGVRGIFGWVKRALWLILLPFALSNLSYWARVRLADGSGQSRWGARASRIGALLLTVFMVLTPCMIAIDLLAWQCYRGDSPGCTSLPGILDFMARLNASQRLAAGSIVPVATLAVLWLLSRQSMSRYEDVDAGDEAPTEAQAMAAMPVPEADQPANVLANPKMWTGKRRTEQLQRVHLTVGLALVTCFSGVHVMNVAQDFPVVILLTTMAAGLAALLAACWMCVIHPHDIDYTEAQLDQHPMIQAGQRFFGPAMPALLLLAAAAVLAVHVLLLLFVDLNLEQPRDFAGHNMWFISVFVVLTATHLSIFTGGRMNPGPAVSVSLGVFALAVLTVLGYKGVLSIREWMWWVGIALVVVAWAALSRWHYRQGEVHASAAWNGAGASVLLAAAAWIGLLFTTGVVTATADYLNGDGHGVDDLVTKTSLVAQKDAAPYVDRPTEPATQTFRATGDVTAKDAIVTLTKSGPVVVSGKVEVKSLFQAPDGDKQGLERALDSTRVQRADLSLSSGALILQDSCLRKPSSTTTVCSAEYSDFVPSGSLPLTGTTLRILSGGDPVTLVVTEPPQMPLVIPQVLIWAPITQLLWVVILAGWVGFVLWRFRRAAPAINLQVDQDDLIAARDKGQCKKVRRTAALAHRGERILDGIGAITAVLALALIVAAATERPPWDLEHLHWTRNIATLSLYLVVALSVGLLFLASRLRTSETARRGVGVVWDLTTFWPRAAHPLAPPCYAERVVPELVTRAGWALAATGPDGSHTPRDSRFVFSAHSQGSVIATAVLSLLSREQLSRTRVITYGSQVRALYGRVFPQVLGPAEIGYVATEGPTTLTEAFPEVLDPANPRAVFVPPAADPTLPDDEWAELPVMSRLFTAGGDWVNLLRLTDPLGYRVFADADSDQDQRVTEVPEERVGDPGPVVATHSGYQHSSVYRAQVAQWTGETPVPSATGTQQVPQLPRLS